MWSRRCGVDIAVVVLASVIIQLCWTTVVNADDDEEQKAREWLERFYGLAEQRYYAWHVANWDFNVNITDENKQRVVSKKQYCMQIRHVRNSDVHVLPILSFVVEVKARKIQG